LAFGPHRHEVKDCILESVDYHPHSREGQARFVFYQKQGLLLPIQSEDLNLGFDAHSIH